GLGGVIPLPCTSLSVRRALRFSRCSCSEALCFELHLVDSDVIPAALLAQKSFEVVALRRSVSSCCISCRIHVRVVRSAAARAVERLYTVDCRICQLCPFLVLCCALPCGLLRCLLFRSCSIGRCVLRQLLRFHL